MNQKGFANFVLVGVVVVLVAIGGYFAWSRQASKLVNVPTEPTTSEATELEPVIYNITPSSGPIGTKITIKGKDLNGFEGDLNARIATEFNSADYSSGIMYGERNGSTDTIVTTIESSFCKQDNSYSGLPCESYFYVTPGLYEISVKPWGKESNSVSFTVTK